MPAPTPTQWASLLLDHPINLTSDYGNLLLSFGGPEALSTANESPPPPSPDRQRCLNATDPERQAIASPARRLDGGGGPETIRAKTSQKRGGSASEQPSRAISSLCSGLLINWDVELKPACNLCHARKVRCDFVTASNQGKACSNCQRGNLSSDQCTRHRRKPRKASG